MRKSMSVFTSAASTLLCAGLPQAADAALVSDAQLLIGAGSYWAIEAVPGTFTATPMTGHDHLWLGMSQLASIDHWGPPDGTESPGIDEPMRFFETTTLHQTTSPVTVLSASGNTATLDFSGWEWVWHFYSHGTATGAWDGNSDGVAEVVCAVDCGHGDTYVLNYSGVMESGTGSGIGGERYQLHLEGTISAVPLPATVWLFGSGLLGMWGVARRKQ